MGKRVAGAAAMLFAVLLVFAGCSARKAPETQEEIRSRILNCGWDLSFTEDRDSLGELAGSFDFRMKGALKAYLTGKDAQGDLVLEVMVFEYEEDAAQAEKLVGSRLADASRYGRTGTVLWYGTAEAVKTYLSLETES